jgi:hypothetical protein
MVFLIFSLSGAYCLYGLYSTLIHKNFSILTKALSLYQYICRSTVLKHFNSKKLRNALHEYKIFSMKSGTNSFKLNAIQIWESVFASECDLHYSMVHICIAERLGYLHFC